MKNNLKFLCLTFICLLIYKSNIAQSIAVKTLSEELIPKENRWFHTALKNADGSWNFYWFNSLNTELTEGTFTQEKVDASYKKLSERLITNTATPDVKRTPIPIIFRNNETVFLSSSHYFTGGYSNLRTRGLRYTESGSATGAVIDYLNRDDAVWSYVGLMPHFIFSPDGKYYACIYTNYAKATPKENRGLYFALYDASNKQIYKKEKFIVGTIESGIEFYVRKYALSNDGELYVAASKTVSEDIKNITVYHFSVKGELLGKAVIANENDCYKDYNIAIVGHDLMLTGIIEETKLAQKSVKHKMQFLKNFFYAKVNGSTHAVENYVESSFDLQANLIKERNLTVSSSQICNDCIRVRDVINNGENTWVIVELNTGLEVPNMCSQYNALTDIVVLNLDASGNIKTMNKIVRNSLPTLGYHINSTFFDDIFKTYRYQVYDNKLYLFYNLNPVTATAANSEDMKPLALSEDGGVGYYSIIDNMGKLTQDRTSSIFKDNIYLKSFSVIAKDKVMFQLGGSKKIVEVTLK